MRTKPGRAGTRRDGRWAMIDLRVCPPPPYHVYRRCRLVPRLSKRSSSPSKRRKQKGGLSAPGAAPASRPQRYGITLHGRNPSRTARHTHQAKEAPPTTRPCRPHRANACPCLWRKGSLCSDARGRPALLAQALGDVVDPLGVHAEVGVADARRRENGDLRARRVTQWADGRAAVCTTMGCCYASGDRAELRT